MVFVEAICSCIYRLATEVIAFFVSDLLVFVSQADNDDNNYKVFNVLDNGKVFLYDAMASSTACWFSMSNWRKIWLKTKNCIF